MFDFRVFSLHFSNYCVKKYRHLKIAPVMMRRLFEVSALSSSYCSGCWLVTLRRKTLRLWWQSLFSQCNSPFYTIKVTLYDSCQLAWLAQFRIERCVWSSQRSGLDSRSSQAWIFQVLFQPLILFIIYWEDHLHPYKVPTRYKAVHFLTNLNLSFIIYHLSFEHSYILQRQKIHTFLPRRATKVHTS